MQRGTNGSVSTIGSREGHDEVVTLKHDRGADRPDEPGVPDDKVDPLVQGWETALGADEETTDHEEATADEVARNEDLERDPTVD